MIKKSLLFLALALSFAVLSLTGCNRGNSSSVGASSRTSSGVTYKMASEDDFEVRLASDMTVIIHKYIGEGGYITIPATIQGVQVTMIGAHAFYLHYGVTGVQLPEGIRSIGESAFESSAIITINIPSSVTSIGNNAFRMAFALESISIPDSVTTFGYNLFTNSGLKSFTFPEGMVKEKTIKFREWADGTGMFEGSRLEKIVIPEGIESIGSFAFKNCTSLTSVTLPSTIKTINPSAFRDCSSLTEVIIPESVVRINFPTFYGPDDCFIGANLNIASQAALRQRGWSGRM